MNKNMQKKVDKVKARLENGAEKTKQTYEAAKIQCVRKTVHDPEHKLAGIDSVGTTMQGNERCNQRILTALLTGDLDNICLKCYADRLTSTYKPLDAKLEVNLFILSTRILTEEEIANINLLTFFVRIESFGDVMNKTMCINYINIIRYYNMQNFAIWSKNLDLWCETFDEIGKPENTTFVFSSTHIDKVDPVPAKWAHYVDHVFTVCSTAEKAMEMCKLYDGIPCAGIKCLVKCGCKCYKRDTKKYVFEVQR